MFLHVPRCFLFNFMSFEQDLNLIRVVVVVSGSAQHSCTTQHPGQIRLSHLSIHVLPAPLPVSRSKIREIGPEEKPQSS